MANFISILHLTSPFSYFLNYFFCLLLFQEWINGWQKGPQKRLDLSVRYYRVPLATKNVFKNAFIPGAISILNSTKWPMSFNSKM